MKIRRVLAGCALAIVVLACALLMSEAAPSAEARLDNVSVRAVETVVVRMQLRAGADQLVIPCCGADEAQSERLCGLGVTLEVHSDQGWRPAKPTPGMGVLGGMPLSEAKPRVIQPNATAAFAFEFAKNVFVVKRGQQARLVIDAWANGQAIGAHAPSLRLVGPTFAIP